jgi:hypothetical protein
MTEALYKSRRDFLGTALAGTALALTSVPLPALAATATRKLAGRPALALYQPHDAHATAFADALAAAGIATLALTDDPVRQWRDGLGRLVTAENFILLGLGNWSDYLVLRGLAAEQRRFPLVERQLSRTAGTVAARREAQDLLALIDAADLQQALQALNARTQARSAAPSMFSWVI